MEPLKPAEIQLGNLINCFGGVEMVTGITPRPDGSFYIHHSGDNQTNNPLGDGVLFDAYPIELTPEWLRVLRVEKYELPKWIRYVHEVQNYIRWYVGIELLPEIDFNNIPEIEI